MRLLAVLVVVLGAFVGLLVPSPADSPLGRVASIDADGRDPRWDTPLDGAALRRAGTLLPDDARYFLWAPAASPLLRGNLKAATQLLLSPALPVQDPADAEWLVSYRASPPLPLGVAPTEQRSLGRGVVLVRLRR